jgi:hypothetical protein
MAALPLTHDRVALVDSADLPFLTRWRWEYLPNGRSGYAIRRFYSAGKTVTIYLHRQLLTARTGEIVDHVNGDGLDNRRENLRLATVAQNAANRAARPRDIPYRGVYRSRAGGKPYKAMISIGGKCKHLGWFARMEDAARAYDAAAFAAFGRFARLNFADQLLPAVEQLLLPFADDQVEEWPAGFEFPPAPATRMDWEEMRYYRQLAWNEPLPIDVPEEIW